MISSDTLVLTEEFCDWQDSNRRIDLLGLDKDANLVVIELKRTDDGGHMELQALRYAAMVSTMTFEKAVEVHGLYLSKLGRSDDARGSILAFLGWDQPDDNAFAQDARKGDAARISRETERRQWDEADFMAALEVKRGAEIRKVAKAILDWVTPRISYVWWGKGRTMGSFIPVLLVGDLSYQLFALWTYGSVEIYFQWLSNKPAFADESHRLVLRDRLQEIPGVEIPQDRLSKRPSFDIKLLIDPKNLDRFFEAYDWALQHVHEYHVHDETEG